jgi:hypothetical protein
MLYTLVKILIDEFFRTPRVRKLRTRRAPWKDKSEPTRKRSKPINDNIGKPYLKTRTLCSDGRCIGVIGTDGRCKVCGRLWKA